MRATRCKEAERDAQAIIPVPNGGVWLFCINSIWTIRGILYRQFLLP